MSEDEAVFIHALTDGGTLQAAQTNALLGSARGVQSNRGAQAVQVWMGMFSYTEQLNRRATALASYRMEKDRMLAGGTHPDAFSVSNPDSAEQAIIYEKARIAVNTSQGEYAMFNRPEMARGNWFQYIFMYKQFVIISVQLMKNLSAKERLVFLGMMILMGGIKGVPFMEDLFDVIDTLKQYFGIQSKDIEVAMAEFFEDINPFPFPLAPLLMHGLVDQIFGGTWSTRSGLGNIFPGTEFLLDGVDKGRAALDVAGAPAAALVGTLGTAQHLGRYMAEVYGL